MRASSKVSFFSAIGVSGNPPGGLNDELIYRNAGQMRSNNCPSWIAWSKMEGLQMRGFDVMSKRLGSSHILAVATVRTR